MQHRQPWIPAAMTCLLLLLVAGCGTNDARKGVRGMVTLDGAPLADGLIRFRPAPGTQANTSGGPICGGRFELLPERGLPPGEYLVEIEAFEEDQRSTAPQDNNPVAGPMAPRKKPIPLGNADPLRATVTADGKNNFEFALTRAASRRGRPGGDG